MDHAQARAVGVAISPVATGIICIAASFLLGAVRHHSRFPRISLILSRCSSTTTGRSTTTSSGSPTPPKKASLPLSLTTLKVPPSFPSLLRSVHSPSAIVVNAPTWYAATLAGITVVASVAAGTKVALNGRGGILFDGASLCSFYAALLFSYTADHLSTVVLLCSAALTCLSHEQTFRSVADFAYDRFDRYSRCVRRTRCSCLVPALDRSAGSVAIFGELAHVDRCFPHRVIIVPRGTVLFRQAARRRVMQ